MTKKIFIKPAAGLRVIDPDTNQPLPAEGALVRLNKYYRRRLLAGDVVEASQTKTVSKPVAPSTDTAAHTKSQDSQKKEK